MRSWQKSMRPQRWTRKFTSIERQKKVPGDSRDRGSPGGRQCARRKGAPRAGNSQRVHNNHVMWMKKFSARFWKGS